MTSKTAQGMSNWPKWSSAPGRLQERVAMETPKGAPRLNHPLKRSSCSEVSPLSPYHLQRASGPPDGPKMTKRAARVAQEGPKTPPLPPETPRAPKESSKRKM